MSARRCEPGCRKNAVFGSTEKPLSNSAAFVVHARIEKCFFPLLPAEPLDRVARRHLVELDPELDEIVTELFGASAAEMKSGKKPLKQKDISGGTGLFIEEEITSMFSASNVTLVVFFSSR